MRAMSLFCVGGVLALCAAGARADGLVSDLGVSAHVGTLGAGVMLTKPLADPRWSVSLDLNGGTLSHAYSNSGIDYDGQLHLQSLGALANVAPWPGSSFHLSAGVYYDANHFDLNARAAGGAFVVNGKRYANTELLALDGRVKFNPVAPYVGVGWGGMSVQPGWHVLARLGVLYQGTPQVDLHGTSSDVTGSAAYDSLLANIEAQRQKIRSDVGSLRWWPVASIGVQYRF